MGGKNAIIIDSDADLDEAVVGVIQSTPRLRRAKCSACSRVVALDGIHDAFVARLAEAARPSWSDLRRTRDDRSALIDPEARQRVLDYARIARTIGKREFARRGPRGRTRA